MNGRVYHAALDHFISADPFVQAPFNSQSLNRYSYVFNNPLSFTDPTGFITGDELGRLKHLLDGAGGGGPNGDPNSSNSFDLRNLFNLAEILRLEEISEQRGKWLRQDHYAPGQIRPPMLQGIERPPLLLGTARPAEPSTTAVSCDFMPCGSSAVDGKSIFDPDDRFFPSFARGFSGEGRSVVDGPAPIGERIGGALGFAVDRFVSIYEYLNETRELETPSGQRVPVLTGAPPLPGMGGGVLTTAKSARFLTRIDKGLIAGIKQLPSGAKLNPAQLRALEKNLDAVLYDVLPDVVRAGNKRGINNALDLLKGVRDKGGARFRSEFVNQISGAQQKISEQLRALGL
jgi:hypothetical protein